MVIPVWDLVRLLNIVLVVFVLLVILCVLLVLLCPFAKVARLIISSLIIIVMLIVELQFLVIMAILELELVKNVTAYVPLVLLSQLVPDVMVSLMNWSTLIVYAKLMPVELNYISIPSVTNVKYVPRDILVKPQIEPANLVMLLA